MLTFFHLEYLELERIFLALWWCSASLVHKTFEHVHFKMWELEVSFDIVTWRCPLVEPIFALHYRLICLTAQLIKWHLNCILGILFFESFNFKDWSLIQLADESAHWLAIFGSSVNVFYILSCCDVRCFPLVQH